jgi:uncharacterized protein (DUF433 family)
MIPTLEAIPVPLQDDGHGGLRVGSTRVPFERVWHAYQRGASPKEIVRDLDTLDLADVHAVLAWALRHTAEVEDYLQRREREAQELRRQLEAAGITSPPGALKSKLLARQEGTRNDPLAH